jgi:hypothetical protein
MSRIVVGVIVLLVAVVTDFLLLTNLGWAWLEMRLSWKAAIAIPVYALALPALGWWSLDTGKKWRANPYLHPVLAHPDLGTPVEVADHMEAELGRVDELMALRKAGVTFTHTWMLHVGAWTVDAVPLSGIVWAYKLKTRHWYVFIPIAVTYSLEIRRRDGKQMSIDSVPQKMVEQLLLHIWGRAPWALQGYDKRLEKLWETDKAQLIAEVDRRREEHERAERKAATG